MNTHVSQGINVCMLISSCMLNAHIYALCAPLCTQIFTKFPLVVNHFVLWFSINFHIDLSFCCGYICKINHYLSMCFADFCRFPPPKTRYWMIIDIKMSKSYRQKDTCTAYGLLSSSSNKLKLFVSHYPTPCRLLFQKKTLFPTDNVSIRCVILPFLLKMFLL